MFTKKDFWLSLLLGEVAAWLVLPILKNLEGNALLNGAIVKIISSFWIWPIFLPIVVLVALYIFKLISKKISFAWQLGKFGAIGVMNTLVDWGVLNFLIFTTDIASGIYYSLFKGASFAVAVISSYFWNKFWTFDDQRSGKKTTSEFTQFIMVSVVGLLINVVLASLLVNFVKAPASVSPELWANVGAALGSASGMLWNFLGYKLIVFKNK